MPQPLHETLLIFAKCPDIGRCKTRLVPGFGVEGATALHVELMRRTFATAARFAQRREVVVQVYYAGLAVELLMQLLQQTCAHANVLPQVDGDLGDRLCAAFSQAFTRRPGHVVVIGTDCPFIDEQVLASAFTQLEQYDAVLGPATDGGYYLLGLNQPQPELFCGISWGTETVLRETRAVLERLGLRCVLLPELADVDVPGDVTPEVLAILHSGLI